MHGNGDFDDSERYDDLIAEIIEDLKLMTYTELYYVRTITRRATAPSNSVGRSEGLEHCTGDN